MSQLVKLVILLGKALEGQLSFDIYVWFIINSILSTKNRERERLSLISIEIRHCNHISLLILKDIKYVTIKEEISTRKISFIVSID